MLAEYKQKKSNLIILIIMETRVRYAPSPTGFQHIGGIRTALINYLFAHSHNGTFIVRIEDTDQARSKAVYQDDIFETLAWLGIDADESIHTGAYGPYIQSERIALYRQYAKKLIEQGDAYYCYTTEQKKNPEKIAEKNTDTIAYHDSGYDRSSRDLSDESQKEYERQGIKPVIRLKMPLEGTISIEDELLGTITRDVKDIIIDPILLKSDGFPTYHLANVIDDHLMEITHIMRSQEWVPTTPAHSYLYKILGWTPPALCHLPIVLGEDGHKLSKRNGSLSVQEVKKMGVLPEALINCIALLGWSFDDSREFFTKEELVHLYKKGKLNKSPSKFSLEKLKWFNAHYIRQLNDAVLADMLLPYVKAEGWIQTENDEQTLRSLAPLVRERLSLLGDITEQVRCVFEEVKAWDFSALLQKQDTETIIQGLAFAKKIVSEHFDDGLEEIEDRLRAGIKTLDTPLKLGQVLMPLRIAVTGSAVSPPILALIKIIGLETTMNRIDGANAVLTAL